MTPEVSLTNSAFELPPPVKEAFVPPPAISLAGRRTTVAFWFGKRAFDIGLAIFFLPLFVVLSVGLFLANPVWNRGPMLFLQRRMGRDMVPFWVIKFRTMHPADGVARHFDGPLEIDRITVLGCWLRRTRLDELPQIINVLRGEMSFVGPRPDVFEHAVEYLAHIPRYRERFSIRPGISGLAQVRMGYAEGLAATRVKARHDLIYVRHACAKLEFLILWRTLHIVMKAKGI
jgi:lipopolysaccharide/colanic/teichoic acid biosynthesis glycosyltransferase